jgi:hypothetical protein
MAARIKPALGLRLGITYSWDSKQIPYFQRHASELFLYEQDCKTIIGSIFLPELERRQHVIAGHSRMYFDWNNKLTFDFYYSDSAFSTGFRASQFAWPVIPVGPVKNAEVSEKDQQFQFTFPYMPYTPKSHIYSYRNQVQYRIDPKCKLILYNAFVKIFFHLLRKNYIESRKNRIRFTLSQFCSLPISKFKVNIIALPSIIPTVSIILRGVMKRLYLRYPLLHALQPFIFCLSQRTYGFAIRATGRLSRRRRAWFIFHHAGRVPVSTYSQRISYQYHPVILRPGVVGVKVWISV